jgi:hypothetical protein
VPTKEAWQYSPLKIISANIYLASYELFNVDIMVGRSEFKISLIFVMILMITIPSGQTNHSLSLVKSFQESHISDQMPTANMSLHIFDKDGRSVIQTKSDFKFSTAWRNGEEETGLMFGFDLQSFGSGVNRIEFETVTFHWWAYSYTGEAIFETIRNQSFYLSQTAVGWGHEGTHLTTYDLNVISYVGASMKLVNFTLYSFYNTVICDNESLVFGANFTKHEQGWSSSTFSNMSSVYTSDVSSVSYVLNEALQTPIWLDALPYIIGLVLVIVTVVSVSYYLRERRKQYPPVTTSLA